MINTHGTMTLPRCMVSGLSTLNHEINQCANTNWSMIATRAPLLKNKNHQLTLPSLG